MKNKKEKTLKVNNFNFNFYFCAKDLLAENQKNVN